MSLPCRALVLFGATGDLARRMLWPSLYALHKENLLPGAMQLVGAARHAVTQGEFIERVREAVRTSANAALYDDATFAAFASRIRYAAVGIGETRGLESLRAALPSGPGGVIYYFSTGPDLFGPIALGLRAANLVDEHSRAVVEKPIGHDAASAEAVNDALGSAFAENRIFRIDHYLGKEAVQNLIALRFGNAIFEPLWNSTAIDHVQITVAETVGIEGRWGYYDRAGALRDMVQSHVLQLLCLVAMEPPAAFTPSAVRNEKVKVLWSLRPITGEHVNRNTVRGQYAGGYIDGKGVPGYLEEEGAHSESGTESFVAIRAEVDNWRWSGVPFYLRTGKRMKQRTSEIVIQFKPAPFNIFAGIGQGLDANALLIRLQPNETITLSLMHKKPGLNQMQLGEVALNLSPGGAFGTDRRRIAYERMLLDVLRDNPALFVRRDEIEASWRWIDGIVEGWRVAGHAVRPYSAGSWGPSEAAALTERHGHHWHE
ncbi:glucose-6-phosphate dehydrogenase [Betaproteobacteria bacterium GR16-43]|nr:glucose-6-phosphate dehydrogenase [Betaproteobacteria bacterium GR16-43]